MPLDLLSVLLSAVGFGGLLYGLSAIGEPGHGRQPVPPWIPLVVGVGGAGRVRCAPGPAAAPDRALLDLRPFTYRPFVVALVLAVLVFMCLLGAASILLPLYLQTVLGTSTFVSGLAVLPGGLVLGLLGRPVGGCSTGSAPVRW